MKIFLNCNYNIIHIVSKVFFANYDMSYMMYEYENKINQNLFVEGGGKLVRCGNFEVRDILGSGGVVAWSAWY